MGWESRGGKHLYYTRTRRVNGRLVREYFGRGERAEQAAREDRQRQLERQERERIRATELTPWDTICRAAEQYHHAVEIVYRAILRCEGSLSPGRVAETAGMVLSAVTGRRPLDPAIATDRHPAAGRCCREDGGGRRC